MTNNKLPLDELRHYAGLAVSIRSMYSKDISDDSDNSDVDSDGYGIISSYDGNYDTIEIKGKDYYIFRTN